MRHTAMRSFIEELLAKEINPTLALPPGEIQAFTRSVLERFENPFARHHLSSILLNSVSKFRARLLGPLETNIEASGSLPPRLSFTLAALIALYRPVPNRVPEWRDEARVFETFTGIWMGHAHDTTRHGLVDLTARLVSNHSLWGQDLSQLHTDLVARVADDLADLIDGRVLENLGRLG